MFRPRRAGALNCLLITIRGLDCQDLRCYRRGAPSARAIQRLAKSGVVCATAVASTPPGQATLSAFLLGNWPKRGRTDPEESVLAEALNRGGYRTVALVRDPHDAEGSPLVDGFEVYDGARDCGDPYRLVARLVPRAWLDFQSVKWVAEARRFYARMTGRVLPPGTGAESTTELALHLLNRFRREPFLFWLHFDDLTLEKNREEALAAVDAQIARLMSVLENRDLDKRTLVILAGDGGSGANPAAPIPEPTRVALLWRYPDVFPAGSVCEALVRPIDLVPTILELCEVPCPQGKPLAGCNLESALTGVRPTLGLDVFTETAPSIPPGSSLSLPVHRVPRTAALRMDSWLLIARPGPGGETCELYNLHADPQRAVNLAAREPAMLHALWDRLESYRIPADREPEPDGLLAQAF